MPNVRDKDKTLWGGYISSKAVRKLDEWTGRHGISSRAEFLEWLSNNLDKLQEK